MTGILDFIKFVEASGTFRVIAMKSICENILIVLRQYRLLDDVYLVNSKFGFLPKPNPTIFLKTAQILNVSPGVMLTDIVNIALLGFRSTK